MSTLKKGSEICQLSCLKPKPRKVCLKVKVTIGRPT